VLNSEGVAIDNYRVCNSDNSRFLVEEYLDNYTGTSYCTSKICIAPLAITTGMNTPIKFWLLNLLQLI